MRVQSIINKTLDIVSLVISPDIIKCVRLMNSLLLNEDPVSDLTNKLIKNEFSAALEIISNFEYEGDQRGALHRILTHLEFAFKLANQYYNKMADSDSAKNSLLPWFISKEGQMVHEDIVKICFYQLVCHKLLGSDIERLYHILFQVPIHTDYQLGNYTEAVSRLFPSELWDCIIANRKHNFASKMCGVANRIEQFPHYMLLSTMVQSSCMNKLKKYLTEKLNEEQATLIIEKNVHPYWNMEYYFPYKYIPF